MLGESDDAIGVVGSRGGKRRGRSDGDRPCETRSVEYGGVVGNGCSKAPPCPFAVERAPVVRPRGCFRRADPSGPGAFRTSAPDLHAVRRNGRRHTPTGGKSTPCRLACTKPKPLSLTSRLIVPLMLAMSAPIRSSSSRRSNGTIADRMLPCRRLINQQPAQRTKPEDSRVASIRARDVVPARAGTAAGLKKAEHPIVYQLAGSRGNVQVPGFWGSRVPGS